MNPSQIPEKPLVASMGGQAKVEPAETTFFYQRPDGSIINVKEREAWAIHRKFKQVGVSDGTRFRNAVLEAREIFKTQGLEAAQERIRKGEQEELEAARGNFVQPRNFDTVGLNGTPTSIERLARGL